MGVVENSSLPPALCLRKGRRQWLCVCSMALLWFCSFLTLTAGGQGACFIVWVFSSLCVVNSTLLQGDRQGIVCFFKKRFFCFLTGSLQLGNSSHKERFLKKCYIIQRWVSPFICGTIDLMIQISFHCILPSTKDSHLKSVF